MNDSDDDAHAPLHNISFTHRFMVINATHVIGAAFVSNVFRLFVAMCLLLLLTSLVMTGWWRGCQVANYIN